MAFRRPHPRQRRTCEEYKAELEEENYHLRSELQAEVDSNCQNEKQIRELEHECVRCEQEIQTLNGEIERLENASKEEIDIRDNEKHISSIESLLVDSKEQVEKLRCRIRTISSQKNSPERGNSPDLYNSDDNMATITELANAIDGYLNNRTTTRDILIDQIKRTTRQIRRKENNLHQDLVREQRRRYDAEGERDLAITRRDLAEGGMANVIGDLHQLRTNAQNQVNRMIGNIARKQTRIGELVQEKFALQLLYQRNAHHLQLSRGNIDRNGWIRTPIFYGRPGEDPEDWLRDMQRYIIASRINVAPGAGQAPGREEEFGLVVSCLAGDALNWYNTRVKGKNWRCNNLSDNLGVATLTAVRGLAVGNGGGQIGALNTAGEFQGKAAAEIGRIGAGIATGADIIPNGTWDEDWSIAGGEPVDNAPVAPNAGGGLPVVTIAPGIKLSQLLYLFRTAYTTVEHLKQTAVFGQLMQGDMSVEQFSARIKKVGKLAEMTPEQQKEQFIRGLNPMN
ncbi:unnamed protein product [Rhizophagus irregularis]|nr:unnamed protein product [Rhizophagus irregularis]